MRSSSRAGRTVWRPEWNDQLLEDWPKGVTVREFTQRFGVAPATIHRRAKLLGLPMRTREEHRHGQPVAQSRGRMKKPPAVN